jgi:receptor protein-tyrosine kinase
MGVIEQAVARANEQQKTAVAGGKRKQYPRRERLVLSDRPNASSTIKNHSVDPGAGTFSLPYRELEAEGLVEPAGKRNQLSEEYRAIKRPILSAIENAKDSGLEHGNIVMVTSSVSGEGKTFSAINLAISIAMERDRTVLLVDGDVTNPSAGEKLGFHRTQPGLTDVLLDNFVNVNDVICQSDIPNLRFMPAGTATQNVTELLSSRDMQFMIENLSERYKDQVIIFDSAPMLMTSEASIVADLAGQIVFVVGAETTTQGMVSDSLKMIKDHSRVGFLLNKTLKKQNNIYGHGYGYGYG